MTDKAAEEMAKRTITWVNSHAGLTRFLSGVNRLLAVDTESDHMFAYSPKVCLIQLAHEEATALVDPFALKKDALRPLLDMFSDPEVIKIMHSGHNDINELDRDYGINLNGFYDTQIAARFLGESGAGLAWMLNKYFGVKAQKRYQRFDWRRRPIPSAACDYAAMDVDYLIRARELQLGELEKRNWLDPCLQQCAYTAETTHHQVMPFDPDRWVKIKGARSLNRKGLRIVRDIYLIRHEYCLLHNIQTHVVCSDRVLLHLARMRPTRMRQLEQMNGLSSDFVAKAGERILDIVERAKKSKGIGLPTNENKRETTVPPISSDLFDRVKNWRNEKAKELRIPTHFVATNAMLVSVLREKPTTKEELGAVDGVLPWFVERLGNEFLALITS